MIRRALAFIPPTIALVAPLAATAQMASPLAPAFGNTIVSTYPDGRKGELYLSRDGGYTAKGRRGDPSDGHWTLKGAKLCLKQSHPWAPPFSFCTPLPSGKTWSAKAVTGETISVTIVKGHV